MNNNGKYDDIINLPHYISKKHPQMSLEARSAQFAPFEALRGYDDVIKETARLTNERKEIDESQKIILDEKLQIIGEQISMKPMITFTYYIPDSKKDGGRYATVTGNVKKIDEYKHIIVLEDRNQIPISEIVEIIGEIFKEDAYDLNNPTLSRFI